MTTSSDDTGSVVVPDRQDRRRRTVWWGGGLLSLGLYVALTIIPTSNRASHVLLYLAVMAALFLVYGFCLAAIGVQTEIRRPMRSELATMLLFAALFRLAILAVGLPVDGRSEALRADLAGRPHAVEPFLLYDNDLWRYLWDGHVMAQGLDPYAFAPEQARLESGLEERLLAGERWLQVLDNVSYQRYRSVYPPLTQYTFGLLARVAPASTVGARMLFALLDLGLCLLLWRALPRFGHSPVWTVAYAWNPAVIKELVGSGHPDLLMMLPLTVGVVWLAKGRMASGGAAVGVAALAKLAPVTLLPLLATRRRWRAIAVAVVVLLLGSAPLAAGLADWWRAVRRFGAGWTFNSGPWATVRWMAEALGADRPSSWADGVSLLLLTGALAIAWRLAAGQRDEGVVAAAFCGLAAVVLLSPAVMPWYVLWPLPLAVLLGCRLWIAFTGLAQLSYLFYIDPAWPTTWKWAEYGVLAILAALAWRRRGQRPRPR